MHFTIIDKKILLKLAGDAVENYILSGENRIAEPSDITRNIQKKCGAFVSAYVKGNLRGCLGTFAEDEPVFKVVQKMAIASVSNDSRFERVNISEIPELELEISVLTPRKKIYDPSEIEIGKHGIYLSKGLNRGTFLPQVAVSQNWSAEEYLSNCSRYKAGMGWDGWRDADKYVFEAIVFKSSDYNR